MRPPDRLSTLLEEWARRHPPDQDGADRLARAIRARVAAEEATARRRWLPVLVPLAAAAGAAAIWVAAVLLAPSAAPTIAAAVISPADAVASERLVGELNQVFPDSLSSILEHGGSLDIMTAVGPGDQHIGAHAVLVRVTMLAGAGASEREVSSSQVITALDGQVEVPLSGEVEGSVRLWSHVLPDGRVLVESEVRLSAPLAISASLATVVAHGTPTEALGFEVGETRFRLYLDARRLTARPQEEA